MENAEKELVLCFDGTGNTFRFDGGESNILKIFRMLDRTKENRCMFLWFDICTKYRCANIANRLLLSTYVTLLRTPYISHYAY